MPCFHPWEMERPKNSGLYLKLPCNQCIGCRTDHKQQWALRLEHEMRMHSVSVFITLTYDPQSLPRGSTLVKRHVQSFIKSLRDKIEPIRIRYFACGEYGEQGTRPHYHLIVYGWQPTDGKVHAKLGRYTLYTSDLLSACWDHRGFITWTDASPENCAYVAGYAVKKFRGPEAMNHYTRITQDGEMIHVLPEFALMSTRPGIGASFYNRYREQLANHDHSMRLGKKQKLPRYYDKLREREDAKGLDRAKNKRIINARKHRANNTPERLKVRETVAARKAAFQKERKALR